MLISQERITEMDVNSIILMYSIVAIGVAIISATIMRAKLTCWDRFGIYDVAGSMFLGVVWPLTIVAWVVYLVSDFLYCKFYK